MAISDDMQLLQAYAGGSSEAAFATLVSRHINLVYSAALRRVGNPHQAEEIAQAVFVILARKAPRLRGGTVLSGWLYQTTRLTAANFVRAENRRHHREHQAHMQSTANEPEPELWQQVGPVLDEAMAQLSETDRNAVVLRFFEGKPLKAVGAALGTTDDAAKMRVNRAVEKLRAFFLKRGIPLSSAGLASAIGENSVRAAPAGLAASVTLGVAQSAALTASTLTWAKGTLKLMAWSKLNMAISLAAVAIIAVEWSRISTAKQQAVQLQEQLRRERQLKQTQELQATKLAEQNSALAKQIQNTARETARARNRSSLALAAAGSRPNPLENVRKNPEMMEAMRDQTAKGVKRLYAPLVKQLKLAPDQIDKFYQALTDNKMSSFFQKADVLAAGGDTAALEKLAADAQKELESSLQGLLGDAGFAQYQEYLSSVPEREVLDQMKDDFADNPLADDQQQRLLQTMQAARQAVAGGHSVSAIGFSITDTSASMDQKLQQQEAINQQVLQQAADFLSPAQLRTLGSSQTNVLNLTRAGFAMAQKMFEAQSNGAAPSRP